MKKETLYFDTSVVSAYYDARAKERQEATITFWKNIVPNYKVFISEITVSELQKQRVKVKTRKTVNLVNIIEGYKEIEIISPQEL